MEVVNDSHHADYDNQILCINTPMKRELTCYFPAAIYSVNINDGQ